MMTAMISTTRTVVTTIVATMAPTGTECEAELGPGPGEDAGDEGAGDEGADVELLTETAGTLAALNTFEMPESWFHGPIPSGPCTNETESSSSSDARNTGSDIKLLFSHDESVRIMSLVPSS
jgi:hypothetical protein